MHSAHPALGLITLIADNVAMIRTVQRVPLKDQSASDLRYWLSRPMAERIAAVEALRLQAEPPAIPTDAQPRLQRVCRVAQRQGR